MPNEYPDLSSFNSCNLRYSGSESCHARLCSRQYNENKSVSALKGSTDEFLMEAYRDGDVPAFDLLYSRYKDMLYRYLFRQCGNGASAEEIFQEAWTGLINNRKNYKVQAKFKTYLFCIAHSKLVDHYRKNAKHEAQAYDDDDPVQSHQVSNLDQPDHQADVRDKLGKLIKLLEELPAPQREVFVMYEEAGMSLSEIAESTQVSRDTAKSRLRYALKRLRSGMERYA